MEIKKIHFAYFTPTQVTRRYVYCVASGMSNGIPTAQYNLTSVKERHEQHSLEKDELLIVALPSFGGRVPRISPALLRNFWGQDTPAVAITTYGNRGYDDTLLEMQDILKEQGFVTVAGAAFVSVHALSAKVGAGRPNADDLQAAKLFGTQVREKLDAAESIESIPLPGNIPFKELPPPSNFSPITNDKCVLCMQCFRWCPGDAITYNNPNETDVTKCILCHGCVVRCPVQARQVVNEPFLQRVQQLEATFADVYCQPEVFL